jgi:FAD-dependent urate hydroxylase
MVDHEVLVVGAGPYGLSAAAHLQHAGADVAVFGDPMEFWREDMPQRMFLRSAVRSSSISAPVSGLMLGDYWREAGSPRSDPVSREDFVSYGAWFLAQTTRDADRRYVTNIVPNASTFDVTLEDGSSLTSRRVVMATGIRGYAHVPNEFQELNGAVSHTSQHTSFGEFAGKRVMVVGSGQSALESAALLLEAGAEVEIVARAEKLFWLPDPRRLGLARRLWQTAAAPPTDVCPPGWAWIAAAPGFVRFAPREPKSVLDVRCLRRAGAHWLRPRLEGVRLSLGTSITSVSNDGEALYVQLSHGSTRTIDHLMLGTGYRVDVARQSFLAGCRERLRVEQGYPVLRTGFESSIRGLHFIGATAARTYGPITRFVVGTSYVAPALARHVRTVRRPWPHLAIY